MVKHFYFEIRLLVCVSWVLGCLVLLFLGFYPRSVSAAVGISPGSIEVGSILSGTIASKSISISRTNTETDTRVMIQVSGPQKDAILGASEMILPKGEQEVPYYFIISSSGLPKDEDLSATLTFLFMPDQPNESGSSIVLSLAGKVNFRVTDQRMEEIEIKQLNFKSTSDGEIELYYFLQNKGNVESRPDSITITLTNRETLKVAQEITIRKEEIPLAPAHSEQNIVFDLEHALASGLYYVEAEVKQGGWVLFHSNKASLQVFGKQSVVVELMREPSFQVSFTVILVGIGSIVILKTSKKTSV